MANSLSISSDFVKMSREELLKFCRELYDERGIGALSYPALKSIPTLYPNLYSKNLPQKILLKELGLESEYRQHTLGRTYKYGKTERRRWSWALLVKKASNIKEEQGRLPPALWFQMNGHAAFVQGLYNLGHTWDQLREAVGDFTDSNFVQSRNGMRWLSHAEASLSNFLHARGVEHRKGRRYNEAFGATAPTRYAIYDLHFRVEDGEWYDVEVWGDRPNGHNEEKYAKVRKAKEKFNASNARFIGIHHADCYDETKLTAILEPALGVIEPFRFDKPADALIYSTHWSNADELLAFCKELAAKMPHGKFPTEDWLRKRGRWANREGDAFNTLAVYIKQWLGGIRNTRKLIGQAEVSTRQWDQEAALSAYKAFFDKHGRTPQQVRHSWRRKLDAGVSNEVAKEAARIASAVEKYAGGTDVVNAILGIKPERQTRWNKTALLAVVKQVFEEYDEATPNQLIRAHLSGKINLPSEKFKLLSQLKDAVSRFPGGMAAIRKECGIKEKS